jgi:peptide/nickel transport system permease protein
MLRFLVRRTLTGLLVLWIISMSVFALFFVAPNNVARTLAGRQATPETVALINHRLGLDDPVYLQYWHFVTKALHGDFGYDYYYQRPVAGIIKDAAPITLSVAVGAAIIWLALGVFNGVISAVHPRSFIDRGLTAFALFFYSIPTFLLGLVMLYFLYYRLTISGYSWFPAGGYVPFSENPGEWFRSLILPWFTVALVSAAIYTRLTRGSMLDVLGEDYIRTARAKGLPERTVVLRHGVRSAITPVVTVLGLDIGILLGGAILTESVFNIQGIGRLAYDAITRSDLPIVQGTVLFGAFFIVIMNLLVDIAYAFLDPRVRY